MKTRDKFMEELEDMSSVRGDMLSIVKEYLDELEKELDEIVELLDIDSIYEAHRIPEAKEKIKDIVYALY